MLLRSILSRIRKTENRHKLDQQATGVERLGIEADEQRRGAISLPKPRGEANDGLSGLDRADLPGTADRWFSGTGSLLQDIRYALRLLVKDRTFTVVIVLTLALGIGINTAIFTLFDLALRPLPVKDPASIVILDYKSGPGELSGFSVPDYRYVRENASSFSGLVASAETTMVLGGDSISGELQQITGTFVSDNFFSVLGGDPAFGRTFTFEEIQNRDRVILLSYPFWIRRFGPDPTVLGKTLRLGGTPFTIVGITNRNFLGLQPQVPDVWLPLTMKAEMASGRDWFASRSLRWLSVAGRLNQGRSLKQAQAEIAVLFKQLSDKYSDAHSRAGIIVRRGTMFKVLTGDGLSIVAVVMVGTGIVLLVACANVANLLLARAAVRQKEIGLRLCIGASRRRIVRQLLTESVILSILGGGFGLLFAWWGLAALRNAVLSALPPDFGTVVLNLNPDVRILTYTLLLSTVTGIAFGLVPAMYGTRVELATTLKEEAGFRDRVVGLRWRGGLVVAQVGLSLVLLIGAGLLVRGLGRVRMAHLGFNTQDVLVVQFKNAASPRERRGWEFYQKLADRLKDLPGVSSVSQVFRVPLYGPRQMTIRLPGASDTQFGTSFLASYNAVTPSYFNTLGIPIVRGRVFSAKEMDDGGGAVIVTESTARRLWPNQEPLGKAVQMGSSATLAQVIGVARDAETLQLGEIDGVLFYLPIAPKYGDVSLLVRASGSRLQLQPLVRAEARLLDPNVWLWTETLEAGISRSPTLLAARAASLLVGILGGLALSLAAVGLYGVIAYSVSRRTKEIGIRLALGAERRSILYLVLGQGMRLVGAGAVLGIAGGAALSRVLSTLLFGLSPFDPVTFTCVTLFLGTVTLFATYLSARRAAALDPMLALRCQ